MNVRKARGRNVGGGRIIGNIAALGALTANGLRGWTGVPKAGEEEGIAEDGGAGPRCFRNMGAGVLSMICMWKSQTCNLTLVGRLDLTASTRLIENALLHIPL